METEIQQSPRKLLEREKSRNRAEIAVSTHQYYKLALDIEKKLVKMNQILTILSVVCMVLEIAYGVAS